MSLDGSHMAICVFNIGYEQFHLKKIDEYPLQYNFVHKNHAIDHLIIMAIYTVYTVCHIFGSVMQSHNVVRLFVREASDAYGESDPRCATIARYFRARVPVSDAHLRPCDAIHLLRYNTLYEKA